MLTCVTCDPKRLGVIGLGEACVLTELVSNFAKDSGMVIQPDVSEFRKGLVKSNSGARQI